MQSGVMEQVSVICKYFSPKLRYMDGFEETFFFLFYFENLLLYSIRPNDLIYCYLGYIEMHDNLYIKSSHFASSTITKDLVFRKFFSASIPSTFRERHLREFSDESKTSPNQYNYIDRYCSKPIPYLY
jgi:hypothetical protein